MEKEGGTGPGIFSLLFSLDKAGGKPGHSLPPGVFEPFKENLVKRQLSLD